MNTQDLFNLLQTSLYLFSALMQADAALLGFGAVFVIYKLQALETIRQSIVQTYYTKGNTHTANMNTLLLGSDVKEIAHTLLGIKPSEHDFQNYCYVILIPAQSDLIKNSVKLPIWTLASHAVFSTVALVLSQWFYTFLFFQITIIGIAVIGFLYSLFLASRLSISLLTKREDYKLEQLRPDIDEAMKSEIETIKKKQQILLTSAT
jgi:hypothetical protein